MNKFSRSGVFGCSNFIFVFMKGYAKKRCPRQKNRRSSACFDLAIYPRGKRWRCYAFGIKLIADNMVCILMMVWVILRQTKSFLIESTSRNQLSSRCTQMAQPAVLNSKCRAVGVPMMVLPVPARRLPNSNSPEAT